MENNEKKFIRGTDEDFAAYVFSEIYDLQIERDKYKAELEKANRTIAEQWDIITEIRRNFDEQVNEGWL